MKFEEIILSLIAALALLLANADANTNSYIWMHQPKFPEKLRKG